MKHFDKVTPVRKRRKKALRKRWSTDRNSLYPNSRHKQDKNIKKARFTIMQSWGKKQEIANKNKIKKRGYETHTVNVV